MGGGMDVEARFMFSFRAHRHKCIACGADLNGSSACPPYTTHAPGQHQRLSLYTILYMLLGSARKVSWAGPAQLKCFARMRVPAYHKPSQCLFW